ncbi:MAG: cobalt ECF transporter T component CbiQ [Desulfobacterales bacterium]
MLDEPFASGNSVIHRLDPRFRVMAAIVYSFVVAIVYRFPALGLALAASLTMIRLAGLDPGRVFYRLLLVNGFVALFWVILPFTAGGEIIYQLGPLDIQKRGIVLAAQITLKSNAILLALIALTATMSFATLGHAMNQLKFPEKLVYLLLLTYRYIFVIEQEYKKILRAIKIRGFSPGTSLHCYKTYAYVIGMLFVRASARAERVYQAMRCRGFAGKFYSLAEFDSSRRNHVFTALVTLAAAAILYLEYLPK